VTKKIIIVLLSFALCSYATYGKTKMGHYYNSSFLGEKSFDHYHGPLDPELKTNSHHGETKFKDDIFIDRFAEDSIEDSFFSLNKFWSSEVMNMNSCPNFYLDQNIDYIRYLYRLITISYLFESLKEQASLSHQLDFSDSVCSLDWNSIFKKCSPKSVDMKRFLRRSKSRYLMSFDLSRVDIFKAGERRGWSKEVLPKLLRSDKSLIGQRLRRYCKNNECLNVKNLKTVLKNSCRDDKKHIQMICSENDSLFGLSWAKTATKLLASSHVMRVLNKNGFAESCLERYTKMQREKEVNYSHLKSLFDPLYQKFLGSKDYVAEGELFLPGALKEFDDRGLKDFLFVKPKVIAKKPIAKPIIKKAPTPKAKPKPVVKVVPKPKPVKVIVPKPKPLSTFELARKKLVDNKLKKVSLNMKLFKKDFIFNGKMIKALEAPLSDFQTREALKDMLTYDKLGSQYQPVRLLFLKFLIDQDKHVGLWNILSVLGSDFYVVNDIEKKDSPVAIRLKNDDSTDDMWQVILLDKSEIKLSKKKGAKK